MSGLVGNPEDRFSHNEAHLKLTLKAVQMLMMYTVTLFDQFKYPGSV